MSTIELSADQMVDAVSEYLVKHKLLSIDKPITFRFQTRIKNGQVRYTVVIDDPIPGTENKPAEVNFRWEP